MSLLHSQVKFGSGIDSLTAEDWVPPEQRANLSALSPVKSMRVTGRNLELWKKLWSGGALNADTPTDWLTLIVQSVLAFWERNGTSATAVATGNILHFHVKNMPAQHRDLLFSHQSFMPMEWISEGPFCLPVLTSEQAVVRLTVIVKDVCVYIHTHNQQAWKAAGCWHRTIN